MVHTKSRFVSASTEPGGLFIVRPLLTGSTVIGEQATVDDFNKSVIADRYNRAIDCWLNSGFSPGKLSMLWDKFEIIEMY